MAEDINLFDPEIKTETITDDSQNEVVSSFLKEFDKYSNQTNRLDKINDIEEDQRELEDMTEVLPEAEQIQMKSSLYFKLLRIYDTEAAKMPKTKPVDTNGAATERNIIDAMKDQVYQDGDLSEVWKDILHGFKAEGTCIVQVGFDGGKDVTVERCELAEMYFDSDMQYMANDSGRKGKNIKTIIRNVFVPYSEFLSMYPAFEGKVTAGSPGGTSDEYRDVYNTDMTSTSINSDTKIGIHYAYSISNKKKPVMAVYAGSSSTLLELHEGTEYPFWYKKGNGEKVAYLPFIDFHYTTVKRGFYSMSMIGMMKDISEVYRKLLRVALPVFEKAVSPLLLLAGTSDQRAIEEMQLAREMQQIGLSKMIPIDGDVRVTSVAPDASIFASFQQARQVALSDANMRFGIDFQALEQQEQTATEAIAKIKIESKAISGLFTINRFSFNRLAKYTTALATNFWSKGDKRIMKIALTDGDDELLEVDMGIVLAVAKDWTGDFETETELKMPMSTQDKANAIREVEGFKTEVLYGKRFVSIEQIESGIEGIYAFASLRELDHIYSKSAITKEAEQILVSLQPPEAEQITEGEEVTEGAVNQDVSAELAPQTMLAEAGVEGVV